MRATLAAMPLRNKLVLGGAAAVALLAVFLLLRAFSAPSFTLLQSGLDPKDTGAITTALDEQGIGYELRANGTSVAVEKAQVGKARVALADAGVSAGASAGPGYELFDKQSMGASDMQQRVNYQRALEGEITRTVDGVDGVSGSQVQLVLPQDELFADEATPATAAVLLEGSADALAPGAVRGISQLVASSVQGLKPENVTITDGTGQLLWPAGDGAGAGAGGAMAGAAKQSAEARYASAMEANLNAMLLGTVGAGKSQVQVNADLDMDKVTRDELRYADQGTPLEESTETERLEGGGAAGGAGGTTGTGGNIPQYAAGAGGGGGDSDYRRRNGTTTYGVDKTVEKVEQAPGAVNKLQVALVLDRSVTDAPAVRDAVSAAAGIDPGRGDVMTMVQTTFPKADEAPAGPVPAGLMTPLKWAGLGLAALFFLLLSWRGLRKKESDALADPEWLREINEPVRLAELETATRVMDTGPRREDDLDQLDQIVERQPERVAAQVRSWMAED